MSQEQINSIDIDVGGTFTDLVFNLNGDTVQAKVPTTPYDLSVCFLDVIEEGARQIGLDSEQLLRKMKLVRYSTTIAMNRLIERKGPRLGLLATEGHEDAILIGRGAQWIDGTRVQERRNLAVQNKPDPLITREMIAGIRERVNSRGEIIRPLDEEDAREKIHSLVDRGARGFIISLLWAFRNPSHERRLKEIIREEYKEYHIGYVPVVLASEVLGKLGEYERTMTTILDAYLHRSMQIELSAMWDKLRDRGYDGSFMMIHNSGGVNEIFRTTASRTYNGGPVAGIMGSAHIAEQLGYKNVVTSDVGGTSFDIGLIVESSVRNYEFRPIIDRWMVGITMLQSLSIGAGGGSIAWINKNVGDRLEVGPQSAGSLPGPACFNRGGSEPTVTDADVVLGYINPDHYYGGQMKLDKARAERAIRTRIANPLGISTPEAAARVRQIVEANMASAIRKEVHLRGYDPEEFILFAFGGAGPTHVAGYMADFPKAIIFPFSPVFCAFGASIMDIIHVYEQSNRMMLMVPGSMAFTTDYAAYNETVQALVQRAKEDLAAEGFKPDEAVFMLELDMLYGGLVHVKRMKSPRLTLTNEDDVTAVYEAFETEFSEAFSPLVVNKPGGVYIENFILKAILPTRKLTLPTMKLESPNPRAAQKGSRLAYWPEKADFVETPVYNFDALKPGNVVEGPGIVEADYTTFVIPPPFRFSIDEHALGIMEMNR